MSRSRILAVWFVASVLFPALLVAQDTLTVGGTPCISGSAGSVVNVPIYIRDKSGTPLGVDQSSGNKLQAFSFRVTPTPASAVATDGNGKLIVTTTAAGITQSLTPSFGGSTRTATTFSYVASYDELTNPIPFTSNAALPGQKVANAAITLASGVASGTTITLTVDPTVSQTNLSNSSANVTETSPSNLSLVDGCITVPNVTVSLACPSGSVFVGGTGTGTVTIGAAQSSATTVTLASGNPSVATVPSSVNIPTGQTTATFAVTGVASGTASITATMPASLGSLTSSCSATVSNPTIAISPSTIALSEGGSASPKVIIGPSQLTNTTITLRSSNTAAATVPASVVIPAGSTSASFTVTAIKEGTAALTATLPSALGSGNAQAAVLVSAIEPVTGGIAVHPDEIHTGESASLVWSTSGGTVTIDNYGANLPASNTVQVSPSATTTYKLTVSGQAGTVTSSATLTVRPVPAPVIITFNPVPASVTGGNAATLSWAITGAASAMIDQGIGVVDRAGGSKTVSPSRTTTYTLTAASDGGVVTKTATVTVNNAPPPTVTSLAGTGKAGSADGAPAVAQFKQPFAVATVATPGASSRFGSDAASYDIFVLDSNHTIRKIHPDGTTETWAGKPGVAGRDYGFRTAATFDFSNYVGAIVANPDGSLEVIDNNLRRHIDPLGNVTNPLDSNGRPCASCSRLTTKLTAGLAINVKAGVIYVSNWGNHTITRIANGVETVIGTGEAGLTDGPPDKAQFNGPRGLTIDSDGTVYVLDTGNNAVRRINTSNIVSTMTVPAAAGGGVLTMGCCASGIAPSPGGGVYVTDPGSNTVKEVGSGGSITTVAGSGGSGSSNGNGSDATFNTPLGVTTAPDGTLIVADTENNTMRGIQGTAPPAQTKPARTRAVKH